MEQGPVTTTVMMPIVGDLSPQHWAMMRADTLAALQAADQLQWQGKASSDLTNAAARLASLYHSRLTAWDVGELSRAHTALLECLTRPS